MLNKTNLNNFNIESLLKKKHNQNNLKLTQHLKMDNINDILNLTENSIIKIKELLQKKANENNDEIIIK